MAIVINGSGTVTGLAVGGLPDGTVDAGTLATDSVTAAKLEVSAITGADLPAGSVLQVLNVVMTTPTAAAVDGWYDITPLVLTITPSSTSSKILVQANVMGGVSNSGWLTAIRIKRGSTVVGATTGLTNNTSGISWMTTNNIGGKTMSTSFLDSPSTTSATTYQVQYNGGSTGITTYIGREGDTATWGAAPTLTLMEIAG
jgi:hypothetical protein